MRTQTVVSCLWAAVLSGCFTVREPETPPVVIPRLPAGKNINVQLAGFEATFVSFTPVHGYTTVTGSGYPWYGRHGRYYHGGFGSTTVSTTTFVPQTESTPFFRNRATDAMEHAGCILQTANPQYRVEVRFSGPYEEDGDGWARAGWMICTLFTADYGAQSWTAKLKVHDVNTGKLVLEKDFTQRYETVVWGPIPFFSPFSSDATDGGVMKMWCLTALTDQAVADALSFFGAK